jgi:hypothetical protein
VRQAIGSIIAIGGLTMWGYLALYYAQHGYGGLFALSILCTWVMGWMVVYASSDQTYA